MTELVRKRINKKPKKRFQFNISKNILKLLEAMGRIKLPLLKPGSKYTPHQGEREKARRLRQMERCAR